MTSFPSFVRRTLAKFSAATLVCNITFSATASLVPIFAPMAVASHNTDLSVTKVVNDSTVNIGDNVTYTITVSNAGGSHTEHVDDVTMTDVLPAGLTYVSHSDDETHTTCTYTSGTTTLSCSVSDDADGKLHKGGSVVITLVATASGCGSVSNTSVVSEGDAGVSESNTANNSDTEEITVSNCGTITIVKDTVPNDAEDFGFSGDLGTFTLDDDSDGTLSNSQSFTKVVGSYDVTEDESEGWELTDIDCGEDAGTVTNVSTRTATIDLDSGENISCTFTNEPPTTGTVTIIKNSIPDDSQTFAFNTTLPGDGTFDLTDDGEGGQPGSVTFTDVTPGSYTVTEGTVGLWELTGLSCDDGDTTTDIPTKHVVLDVDAGDNITCTYTNTKYGTLRIEKDAYGGDDTFDFTIDEEGGDGLFEESITTTEGEGFVEVSVPAGDYGVTETLPDGDDWMLEYNGCEFPVVTPGETTTCTMTNVKKSTIQIRKETVNGFGLFNFHGQIDGEESSDFGGEGFDLETTSSSSSADSFFDVFVDSEGGGDVFITEEQSSSDGWSLTGLSCSVNSSSAGSSSSDGYLVNLNPGEALLCVFTNTQSVCGDGDVNTEDEQCDDGDTDGEDGCSSTCQIESGYACEGEPSTCTADCGDGITAGSEQCDDGENDNGDGCNEFCQFEFCGDGLVNDTEETCDDSNDDAGDGCSDSCQVETGYECLTEGAACTTVCGDGLIHGAEQCDDGESASPGCNSSCEIDEGYQCEGEPSICELHMDFGDAPDDEGEGYPTTLGNNGARHAIVEDFMLGSTVDGETDGAQSTDALGDDTADTDDEDGVTFTTSLVQGSSAGVSVVTSTPGGEGDGYLEGWIDFNQDMDWNDEGEHVITELELSDGTHELTFDVPVGAILGETFARFRWSSEGGEEESGLAPEGFASDGEVEDYLVTIEAPVSESSESSSSSAPADDESGGGGTGGARGEGSNVVTAAIGRIGSYFGLGGGTPPPAFGGTPEANQLICSVQRVINPNAVDAVYELAAQILSTLTGLDADELYANLKDPEFCAEINAAFKPQQQIVVKAPPRPVQLADDGYPVSLENPFWNLCIRGNWTKADLVLNPDFYEQSGRVIYRSCDAYKISGSNAWKFPDDPYLTITIKPKPKSAPVVSVPKGYAVVPFSVWTAAK